MNEQGNGGARGRGRGYDHGRGQASGRGGRGRCNDYGRGRGYQHPQAQPPLSGAPPLPSQYNSSAGPPPPMGVATSIWAPPSIQQTIRVNLSGPSRPVDVPQYVQEPTVMRLPGAASQNAGGAPMYPAPPSTEPMRLGYGTSAPLVAGSTRPHSPGDSRSSKAAKTSFAATPSGSGNRSKGKSKSKGPSTSDKPLQSNAQLEALSVIRAHETTAAKDAEFDELDRRMDDLLVSQPYLQARLLCDQGVNELFKQAAERVSAAEDYEQMAACAAVEVPSPTIFGALGALAINPEEDVPDYTDGDEDVVALE